MKRRCRLVREGGVWTLVITARCGHGWCTPYKPSMLEYPRCRSLERLLDHHERLCSQRYGLIYAEPLLVPSS